LKRCLSFRSAKRIRATVEGEFPKPGTAGGKSKNYIAEKITASKMVQDGPKRYDMRRMKIG
jgi:hypothetical protein